MRVVAGPTNDMVSVRPTDGLGRRLLFGAANNRLAPPSDDALVAGYQQHSATIKDYYITTQLHGGAPKREQDGL